MAEEEAVSEGERRDADSGRRNDGREIAIGDHRRRGPARAADARPEGALDELRQGEPGFAGEKGMDWEDAAIAEEEAGVAAGEEADLVARSFEGGEELEGAGGVAAAAAVDVVVNLPHLEAGAVQEARHARGRGGRRDLREGALGVTLGNVSRCGRLSTLERIGGEGEGDRGGGGADG
jgi:hypothetical protein